jgi:hypothetical protein
VALEPLRDDAFLAVLFRAFGLPEPVPLLCGVKQRQAYRFCRARPWPLHFPGTLRGRYQTLPRAILYQTTSAVVPTIILFGGWQRDSYDHGGAVLI